MQYQVIRSGRRTMALEIRNGELLVRVPWQATRRDIENLLREKSSWIEKHLRRSLEKQAEAESVRPLNPEELDMLARQAMDYIPERVRHYSAMLGVHPGKITIRNQRTRWGSCSAKGNLNFNCILMLAPPEVIDSVIVHELCHLKEMNHSERFYREVLRICPEYYKWHRWLKENQSSLMARLG